MTLLNILVVDDEQDMAESCVFLLERAGYTAEAAFSAVAALERMEQKAFAVVITDLKMPDMSGLQLLEKIKQRDPEIQVVVVTGFPEIETAVEAMRKGALDYLPKPFDEHSLLERVEKAVARRGVRAKSTDIERRLRRGEAGRGLIFKSEAFRQTVATIERVATVDATVLIQGESGTGKDLLAHHLHEKSHRADLPFVPVDCAAIPENLVESELFGHVKGAFSGADASKAGLIAIADGGTLFLDEVGELPLAFQAKLLRTIQERQIRKVGGEKYQNVDIRLVAATNRDLRVMVSRGEFREDLFYRLDVVRLDVPPLRERLDDIEPMAKHFIEEFSRRCQTSLIGIDPRAFSVLGAYSWPGNGRQLHNVIERACVLASGPLLTTEDLPGELSEALSTPVDSGGSGMSFQEIKARKLAAFERAYLADLLSRHGGNVTHAARESGMARSALQKLMQRYTIKSSDYRG